MRELIASCALKLLQLNCPFWNNLPARNSIFIPVCPQLTSNGVPMTCQFLVILAHKHLQPNCAQGQGFICHLTDYIRNDPSQIAQSQMALYAICELWWNVSPMSCSVVLVYKVRGFLLISFRSLVIFIFTVSLFDTFEILLLIVLSFLRFMTYHLHSPSLSSSGERWLHKEWWVYPGEDGSSIQGQSTPQISFWPWE